MSKSRLEFYLSRHTISAAFFISGRNPAMTGGGD